MAIVLFDFIYLCIVFSCVDDFDFDLLRILSCSMSFFFARESLVIDFVCFFISRYEIVVGFLMFPVSCTRSKPTILWWSTTSASRFCSRLSTTERIPATAGIPTARFPATTRIPATRLWTTRLRTTRRIRLRWPRSRCTLRQWRSKRW